MRIAIALEYDGAGYCGWQSQAVGLTIQDSLESALSLMADHTVKVSAAGRTDTGVHALSQIVHFDTHANRPMSTWVRGVNANLPKSIRVLWAIEVDAVFHARFEAHQRSYQYWLVNQPVAPAILADKVGWFHMPLDVDAMNQAAAYLLGEHDFSAFRASECQAKSPVKTLHRAQVRKLGNNLIFDFCANAFLHHQVRNMVGALVYIGKGKYVPEFMQELLEKQDRRLSPPTFAANGLYLTGVGYDAKWGLPETERTLDLLLTM